MEPKVPFRGSAGENEKEEIFCFRRSVCRRVNSSDADMVSVVSSSGSSFSGSGSKVPFLAAFSRSRFFRRLAFLRASLSSRRR